jgi:DnaJ-class molecular chaperone
VTAQEDLVCPFCKGTGRFVAFVDYSGKDRHKSGPAEVTCPKCEGVGDIDPRNDARQSSLRLGVRALP